MIKRKTVDMTFLLLSLSRLSRKNVENGLSWQTLPKFELKLSSLLNFIVYHGFIPTSYYIEWQLTGLGYK